jgi:hypothetical protein
VALWTVSSKELHQEPRLPSTADDWLDLIGGLEPTEARVRDAYHKLLIQTWNTNPTVKFECKMWHGNAARRGLDIFSDYQGPWYRHWPGWPEIVSGPPSLDDLRWTYFKKHPDAAEAHRQRLERQTTKKQPRSTSLRFRVLERDGYRCRYCGRGAPDVELHADHVVPISKGGADSLENMVAACVDCNTGKRARILTTLPAGVAQ